MYRSAITIALKRSQRNLLTVFAVFCFIVGGAGYGNEKESTQSYFSETSPDIVLPSTVSGFPNLISCWRNVIRARTVKTAFSQWLETSHTRSEYSMGIAAEIRIPVNRALKMAKVAVTLYPEDPGRGKTYSHWTPDVSEDELIRCIVARAMLVSGCEHVTEIDVVAEAFGGLPFNRYDRDPALDFDVSFCERGVSYHCDLYMILTFNKAEGVRMPALGCNAMKLSPVSYGDIKDELEGLVDVIGGVYPAKKGNLK